MTTNPWEEAAKRHASMEAELREARTTIEQYRTNTHRLESKIDTLEKELKTTQSRRDHYLGLYYETVKSLNTIGLVIDDAIHTAKIEFPQRQNGGQQVEEHIAAVEHALTDMTKAQATEHTPPKRTDSNKHG